MIEQIIRYQFDNKEFASCFAVEKHIENEIGCIVDEAFRSFMRPTIKERLALFDVLIQYRERLCFLLSAQYKDDDGKNKSIFLV